MSKPVLTLEDGGSAFPALEWWPENGMSLRDWFAGQALAGMCASPPPDLGDRTNPNHSGWADNAYKFADAMLASRLRAVSQP